MKTELERLLEEAFERYNAARFDNVADKNYWRGKIYAFSQVVTILEKKEEDKQNDNSQWY